MSGASDKKILAVIPCRYDSTRLPGKPLADIGGKPMIQRVYERVSRSTMIGEVIVATDDGRIADAVRAFGGRAEMTSPDHPNGTCRAAEAASRVECGFVLNVQGDEPLIDPRSLDELATALIHGGAPAATLCCAVHDEGAIDDPSLVKVTRSLEGLALYFSRSRIPFPRNAGAAPVYAHIGVYGFDRAFLEMYTRLPPTPLAEAESLEQLKILEHGYALRVIETKYPPAGPGVDTPEDLERVRKILAEMV